MGGISGERPDSEDGLTATECRFRRHDLVRVDPSAWAALLRTRPDLDGLPHLPDWAEHGRPLIVRRYGPGEPREHVPLGLPLPPADGKRRIGLALPASALTPLVPPTLAGLTLSPRSPQVPSPVRERDRVRDQPFPDSANPSPQPSPARERERVAAAKDRCERPSSDLIPPAWQPTLDALARLGARHGIEPRPFGALLWQASTGLTYLTETSDLDLLWPLENAVPDRLLDGIARIAEQAPMRVDGELILADGAGIHWRELHAAPEDAAVLAKHIDRLEMRPVSRLLGRTAA